MLPRIVLMLLAAASRFRLPARLFAASRLAVVAALAIAVSTPAAGTTVLQVDSDRLVRNASSIAHVRCVECTSYRNDDGLIVTRYRFQVIEALKGEAAPILECVQPGGRVGNLVTVVPGLASHRVDQELVLFLAPQEPQSEFRLPVGLDQGVYRVQLDTKSGEQVARRDLSHLHRLAPPDSSTGSFPEGLAIAEFKERVRERIRAIESSKEGPKKAPQKGQGR